MLRNQRDSVMANPWVGVAMAFVMMPLIILFFRPSILEFLIFLLVDFLAFKIMGLVDIPIFRRIFPETKCFFPSVDVDQVRSYGAEKRQKIYQEMLDFPRRRCVYVLVASFFKAVPALLCVYLLWSDHIENLSLFLKTLSICAFFYSYQFGITYIEYHLLMSKSLKVIHEHQDWSEVFRGHEVAKENSSLFQVEILCAASVWFFWVTLLVLILADRSQPLWMAIVQTIYVSTCGLCLISLIFFASKNQVTQGIEALREYNLNSQHAIDHSGVALSTYPILAFYQRVLNQMIVRNAASEREIHLWILRRSESNRYLDLGHVAGLMVHDLVTPLTVMRHSLSTLEELSVQSPQQVTYFDRLKFCLQQMTDLIVNVRSSIRNKANGQKIAEPLLAHEAAKQFVTYVFQDEISRGLTHIYNVPTELSVIMPQPELNQVFLNLYSNAMRNMISNNVEIPTIVVEVLEESEHQIILSFKDIGAGLSLETFHFITEESNQLTETAGIGLKLTKRLIELYGGSLSLKDNDAGETGTQFLLTLKKQSFQVASNEFVSRHDSPLQATNS